jgi:hypothetical protein
MLTIECLTESVLIAFVRDFCNCRMVLRIADIAVVPLELSSNVRTPSV